jgi:hypothetical protein
MVFVSQPTTIAAGATLPTVRVMPADVYGNGQSIPPGPGYSATLSLGNNPTGATLGGTLTVAQPIGISAAAFSSITVSTPGTGYTLVATGSLPGGTTLTGTSAPFTVQ